jgi:hypothetical protein
MDDGVIVTYSPPSLMGVHSCIRVPCPGTHTLFINRHICQKQHGMEGGWVPRV